MKFDTLREAEIRPIICFRFGNIMFSTNGYYLALVSVQILLEK